MKIFLVEDNLALSKAITIFFKIKKYSITHYDDGEDAYDAIDCRNINAFDLYIIDINLPNISGLDIVKRIRQIDIEVPIIVITASLDIADLEDGFAYGCNEYIKKPFELKELDIRLNRLVNNSSDKFYNINGSLKFNMTTNQLINDDEFIDLRRKESRFLALLLKNRNSKTSIQEFEEFVWEGEIKESYPLRQLVNGLRRKLPCDFIKTDVGLGYSINENCK